MADEGRTTTIAAGPTRPELHERPLITPEQAARLMGLFKVLANDTRLRVLHVLARAHQMCVTDIATAVGMKPQAISNQLHRLVDQGILNSMRDGANILYQIADPCVIELLDRGYCLLEDAEERRI